MVFPLFPTGFELTTPWPELHIPPCVHKMGNMKRKKPAYAGLIDTNCYDLIVRTPKLQRSHHNIIVLGMFS